MIFPDHISELYIVFPDLCYAIHDYKTFHLSEMAKNGLKLSTMVGENFGIYLSEMAKNGLKFSTMV